MFPSVKKKFKVSKFQGFKSARFQSFKVARFQGFQTPGCFEELVFCFLRQDVSAAGLRTLKLDLVGAGDWRRVLPINCMGRRWFANFETLKH
jgi:hypothetical protein